jgi:hypothetical protein
MGMPSTIWDTKILKQVDKSSQAPINAPTLMGAAEDPMAAEVAVSEIIAEERALEMSWRSSEFLMILNQWMLIWLTCTRHVWEVPIWRGRSDRKETCSVSSMTGLQACAEIMAGQCIGASQKRRDTVNHYGFSSDGGAEYLLRFVTEPSVVQSPRTMAYEKLLTWGHLIARSIAGSEG